jgi:FHA domain
MSSDAFTTLEATTTPAWSAAELQQIIRLERVRLPFLLWRGGTGTQRLFALGQLTRATVGRHDSNDVVLADDAEVSRTHAELILVGADWTIVDDGLSRNGTWVNGTRLASRVRLRDRDRLQLGRTTIEYRFPVASAGDSTAVGSGLAASHVLTDTQRRVLVALCRPCTGGDTYGAPASNNEIAAEVFLGIDAVKNHLRILFQSFGLTDLPQNQKRARLAETVIRLGLVSSRNSAQR